MNVAHLTVRIFQGRALLRVPSCASQKRGQTYKPRGNGKFKKKYSNRDEDECVEECIDDGRDVAVWNERTGSCYCWEERDGQWERDRSGDDNAFEVGQVHEELGMPACRCWLLAPSGCQCDAPVDMEATAS